MGNFFILFYFILNTVTAVDSVCKALEFLGLLEDEETHMDLQVNLIITDYSMPGMTGYDLLRKIKVITNCL